MLLGFGHRLGGQTLSEVPHATAFFVPKFLCFCFAMSEAVSPQQQQQHHADGDEVNEEEEKEEEEEEGVEEEEAAEGCPSASRSSLETCYPEEKQIKPVIGPTSSDPEEKS